MEILLKPEEWALTEYPELNLNGNLKLSNYIIKAENAYEVLLLHTITWSIYALTKEEYENIFQNKVLLDNHVIVPLDLDELSIANEVYIKRMTKSYLPTYEKIGGMVIFTTTACNARCAYCYENSITEKEFMTIETAENIVQFIKKNKSNNNKPFRIQWFGGEPLLNVRIIDYIVDRLNELEIPFYSTMISNAFLMTNEVIEKFDKWKMENIQITLDGLNDDYNNAKNYVYPDIDAYMVVLENIHNVLKNSNAKISIRLNASNDNIFKLQNTIDFLIEEFKDYYRKKLSIYVAPLYDYVIDPDKITKEFWEELNNISKKIKVAKLSKCEEFLEELTFKRQRINGDCMAFNGISIAVMPNGKFSPCEHVKDEDIFGDVINGVQNLEVIKRWQFFDGPEIDYCKEIKCPFHPMCPKLYQCDNEQICYNEEQINKRLEKAIHKLVRTRIYYTQEKEKNKQ